MQSKLLGGVGGIVTRSFVHNAYAIVNFAVAAVAIIAVVGAISAFVEKYLTTSVSQWVAHDLRRTLYQHIQRLSLAERDKAQTGDLITRVTSDIGAIQDFINSALLGMLVDVMTLVGMIGVMFYLNWRFTLIALSVSPVLFLVVYYYTRHQESFARRPKAEGLLLSIVSEVLTSIRRRPSPARLRQQRFESESLANVEAASMRNKGQTRRWSRSSSPSTCGLAVRGWARRGKRRRAHRLPAVSGQDVQADADLRK